jgi:hypothetical protein
LRITTSTRADLKVRLYETRARVVESAKANKRKADAVEAGGRP